MYKSFLIFMDAMFIAFCITSVVGVCGGYVWGIYYLWVTIAWWVSVLWAIFGFFFGIALCVFSLADECQAEYDKKVETRDEQKKATVHKQTIQQRIRYTIKDTGIENDPMF